MAAAERRELIMATLRRQRRATVSNLAAAFGCSERTILRDIEALSATFPLITKHGRYGGGVELVEWYHPNSKTLAPEQITAIRKVMKMVDDRELLISLGSILDQFDPKRFLQPCETNPTLPESS